MNLKNFVGDIDELNFEVFNQEWVIIFDVVDKMIMSRNYSNSMSFSKVIMTKGLVLSWCFKPFIQQ